MSRLSSNRFIPVYIGSLHLQMFLYMYLYLGSFMSKHTSCNKSRAPQSQCSSNPSFCRPLSSRDDPTCNEALGLTLYLRLLAKDCLECDYKVVKITHIKIFSEIFSSWTRNVVILGHLLNTEITIKPSLKNFILVFSKCLFLF